MELIPAAGIARANFQKSKNKITVMNTSPIYLTWDDHSKLRHLLATTLGSSPSPALKKLKEEVDRALVIDPSGIPEGYVTLESEVEYEDLETGGIESYIITVPARANIDDKRLSVLAPIGTALIGCRVGDTVRWNTPGGSRRLKIHRVTSAATLAASEPAMPSWG